MAATRFDRLISRRAARPPAALDDRLDDRPDDRPDGWLDDWLSERTSEWVAAGIVSTDQADAIRRLEATGPVRDAGRRVSIAAEVVVYLGSLLALVGGAAVVGRSWENLLVAGRLTIGVAVAALGFLAGRALIPIEEPGTSRLASYMWLVGTGGVTLSTVTVLDQIGFEHEGWNAVLIGLPVLAIGGALWRNLDRPLQLLTTVVGLGLTAGGLLAVGDVPIWLAGVAMWLAAIGIGLLALAERLRPATVAVIVAAVGAIVGASMLGDLNQRLGSVAATLTAGGVVAVGLRLDRTVLLVVGVLGFLQTLPMLMATTFDGPVAAMLVAVVGLTVTIAVLARSIGRPPPTSGRT